MDFYHGSIIGNLTELKPFSSKTTNLKEPMVYLSTNKQLALHYIKDRTESPTLKICEDGKLIFQEMFSNALKILYKGKSGYIYHCVGDYTINEQVGVMYTATSNKPVLINDFEYIEDVYEKIMEYEKIGMFVYEKYENRSEQSHWVIRGWVMKWIKEGGWINDTEHPEYKKFKERWPKYLKEAEVLVKYDLL
jgi:hypothetical protein